MPSHYCFVDDDRRAIPCMCVRGEDHTEDEFDVPATERVTSDPATSDANPTARQRDIGPE